MKNYLIPPDRTTSCPMFRRAGESETGSRIGGRAPAGVLPNVLGGAGVYLATISLMHDGSNELSIFYAGETFRKVVDVPENVVVADRPDLIEVVVHEKSRRSSGWDYGSDLSENPLFIGEPRADVFGYQNGSTAPLDNHKIGGRPFLYRNQDQLQMATLRLEQDGFWQVLQLGFIVKGDAPWRGAWPFLDGMFHLFGRAPFEENRWAWIWQF